MASASGQFLRESPYKNIEEAYGSYLAPVGKGLQIDVGKFVTNAGAEVIEAKDDWNYSRSLLFQLAIPLYHAGVRLTYSPNDKVTLMGGVINGWNDVNDNNTAKSVMASVTFKPSGSLSIIENYIGGPEQPNNNDDWRNLSDTVISYTVNPKLSLMANYDYGHDTMSRASARQWQGVAGYLKYQAEQVRGARAASGVLQGQRRLLHRRAGAEPDRRDVHARSEAGGQLHVADRVPGRFLERVAVHQQQRCGEEESAAVHPGLPLQLQLEVVIASDR